MAVSFAVSTQYSNVTDRHPATPPDTALTARAVASLGCSRAAKTMIVADSRE